MYDSCETKSGILLQKKGTTLKVLQGVLHNNTNQVPKFFQLQASHALLHGAMKLAACESVELDMHSV